MVFLCYNKASGDFMDIQLLVKILKDGGLAIIPTDTTYGLVADATNEKAINKVYDAKKRDRSKPLLILVSDITMLKKYVKEITPLESKIMQEFWPGPLTILFSKNELLSDTLTSGKKEVAIRLPNNKELINLITELDRPIIATSANLAGESTITSTRMLENELLNKVSYVYDDGKMNNVASTLIKVEDNKIIFLREGILTKKIKEKFKDKIKKTFND